MRLIWEYLKLKRKPLFLLFIFIFIYASVFHLYDLPVEAVGYAGLLCMVVLIILGTYDFIKFLKNIRNWLKCGRTLPFRQITCRKLTEG